MEKFPDFMGTFNSHISGFIEESVKYISISFSLNI